MLCPGPGRLIKLGDLFKNVSWSIMRGIHILKYLLRAQETYDEAVDHNSCALVYVPDQYKTQKMCNEAVRKEPCSLEFVPDYFKTQKMCDILCSGSQPMHAETCP